MNNLFTCLWPHQSRDHLGIVEHGAHSTKEPGVDKLSRPLPLQQEKVIRHQRLRRIRSSLLESTHCISHRSCPAGGGNLPAPWGL